MKFLQSIEYCDTDKIHELFKGKTITLDAYGDFDLRDNDTLYAVYIDTDTTICETCGMSNTVERMWDTKGIITDVRTDATFNYHENGLTMTYDYEVFVNADSGYERILGIDNACQHKDYEYGYALNVYEVEAEDIDE